MKKEYNILSYFCMRALFMGIGLSRILSNTHEYFYISIIIGSLLGLILLKLIKIDVKAKYINIFLNSILIIMSLLILINMISTMYLTKMPKFLIGLPFIISIIYLLSKNEKIIFRLGNILIIFNIILYCFSFFTLLKYFKISNYYFTEFNIKNILFSSFEYAIFSITPVILTKSNEYKNINIYKTYIISSITMILLFGITYGVLGANVSSIIRYPEYLVLKQINLGPAVENIENIISLLWLYDLFMMMSSCANAIKKEFNNNLYLNILLIILLLITSYSYLYYNTLIFSYKYAPFILLIILFLYWIFNKEKRKNN